MDEPAPALGGVTPGAAAGARRGGATWWESGAAAIAATSGADDDDLVPAIVARTLWFTHRSIFLEALNGLLAEEDREQLAARLREAADRAYDQLVDGLGEYGKRG